MNADQQWKMRATHEEKRIIRRTARRLKLTQAGLVKLLVKIADEVTQEGPTNKQITTVR